VAELGAHQIGVHQIGTRAAPGAGRLIWPDTAVLYPEAREAGIRVARCHDVALTEALLLGHERSWGEPRSLAACWARLAGAPVPADAPDRPDDTQDALFGAAAAAPNAPLADGADPLDALVAVHAEQQVRISAAREVSPGFTLLVAAESASALAAVEMSEAGLPWRADVHDDLLVAALGPRPAHRGRPPQLQALAEQVAAALGEPRLNPDSQPEVLRALRRAGVAIGSTRKHELRHVEHPAVAPLLRYKELARLNSANGWAWREQWVRNGRFHPEYLPALELLEDAARTGEDGGIVRSVLGRTSPPGRAGWTGWPPRQRRPAHERTGGSPAISPSRPRPLTGLPC